jgi:ribosomal protein S18 acetylase RimI-like enzyme
MTIETKILSHDNKEEMINATYVESNFDYIDSFIDDPSSFLLYALVNDQVVGYTYGYFLSRINSKPMAYIHSVDVKKDYRNQGIGRHLMVKTLDYIESYGVIKTFLFTNQSNHAAMALYKSVKGTLPYGDDQLVEWKKEEK